MAKKVADKLYLGSDGEESRSASPDAVALLFRFANGEEIKVNRADVPENIAGAAMLHGLAQKIGDTYAGAENLGEAVEKAKAMAEQLLLGSWTTGRQASGPRIQHLVDAIAAAKEVAGQEVDREAIAQKLRENEELRKGALNNPQVRAQYDKQKAERAAAQAKESAKAAKDADTDALAAF